MSNPIHRIVASAMLMLVTMGVQTSAAQTCDRACLKDMMTAYLNALVAQDPSKAPLAANVRFTEDAKELKVGDGFWKQATKVGDYRQDFIDVKEQAVASWVIVEESGRPAKLTARLKVAGGRITEIETLVGHAGERANGGATMVTRPDMGIAPPAGQRNSREELIRIADFYPKGLTMGGFDKVDAPFAKDAYRLENGMVMAGPGCGRGGPGGPGRGADGPGRAAGGPAGASAGTPPAAPPAPPADAGRGANVGGGAVSATRPQDVAGCGDIKTQRIIAHPDLTKSVVAVDEEEGTVLLWMNFGDTGSYGAGNALIVYEGFKVYGGQIHAVEAFMKVLPKDTPRGWGKMAKGMD
jgi:hypothetical protein